MVCKIKSKYLLAIIGFVFTLCFSFNCIFAGSLAVNVYTSVEEGKTINLTISANNLTGKVNISSSNANVLSANMSQTWVENNSITVVLTGKSAGTANIIITPTDVSDSTTGDAYTGGSITESITVNKVDSGNSGNGNNGSGSGNSGNTNTKSSNANLSSLKVNYEGMSPTFNASKTNYAVTVGQDINSLNVTAYAQDSKAKVSVSGNTNFKDGDNYIYITVTAENGAKKTYKITVTRTSDPTKSNAYLESLIIENAKLSPEFQREVLEYDCGTVGADIEKLTILTFPENKQAKFEIIGNDKLVAGENKITIKVTAVDGTTTKEYVIKVTKEAEATSGDAQQNVEDDSSDLNITKTDNEFVSFFKNLWRAIKANSLLVLMYILVIVEFIQIVYLYRKLNKKDKNDTDTLTGRKLVKKDIKENVIEEGSSAEQIMNAPRTRSAINQSNVKDITEEKKELELNEDEDFKVITEDDNTEK